MICTPQTTRHEVKISYKIANIKHVILLVQKNQMRAYFIKMYLRETPKLVNIWEAKKFAC